MTESVKPSVPVTEARLQELLRTHDPQGAATSLALRGRDNTLVLGAPGRTRDIDLASGALRTAEPSALAGLYRWARPVHEHLVFDMGWLVIASTVALLVLAVLGVLMGWPRLRNTLGGWHTVSAWVLLPLVVLSPATGLMIALGLGNSPPPAGGAPGAAPGGRVALVDVVAMVARQHDVADLSSVRTRGGRMMVRVVPGAQPVVYAVSPAGLRPLATNWPRALHEGNWNVIVGPLANGLVSVLFLGLMGTGLTIWLRRRLKQAAIRRSRLTAAQA
jgi:uncharacterized iron-regulated membrane protein